MASTASFFWIVLPAVLSVACGSSSSDPIPSNDTSTTCVQRSGTYSVTFQTKSGNCGPQDATSVPAMEMQGMLAPPCTGTSSLSANNCVQTLVARCAEGIAGTAITAIATNEEIDFSADGTAGSAVFEITEYDSLGDVACTGTYDAFYTRN